MVIVRFMAIEGQIPLAQAGLNAIITLPGSGEEDPNYYMRHDNNLEELGLLRRVQIDGNPILSETGQPVGLIVQPATEVIIVNFVK